MPPIPNPPSDRRNLLFLITLHCVFHLPAAVRCSAWLGRILLPPEPKSPVRDGHSGPNSKSNPDCPQRGSACDVKWKIELCLPSFGEEINEQTNTCDRKNSGKPAQATTSDLNSKITGAVARIGNVFVLGILHAVWPKVLVTFSLGP
jgi:hypothetical protein